MEQANNGVRLDKWLWAARFYKHRKLATEAIQGGRVHLNGQRIKPARLVHEGDELEISRGTEIMTVKVLALSDRRGSAPMASKLFEETLESMTSREQARQERRFQAEALAPDHRPSKRDRRKLREFSGKF
jgi:ribosome-associated heat shock protein Hsp15